MKLHGTPLSHYTRKVRILLDLYRVPYEFIDVGNVAEGDQETYAGNPLMKVPVMLDGGDWLIESDHIAEYVSRKFDPVDLYGVLAQDPRTLNIRAVLNGLMSEEVKVILAKRTGVPVGQYRFFESAMEAIANSFVWLEQNVDAFNSARPGYLEFHLTCAFEHVSYYDLVPLEYPGLRAVVESVLRDPIVQGTSPFRLKPKTAS